MLRLDRHRHDRESTTAGRDREGVVIGLRLVDIPTVSQLRPRLLFFAFALVGSPLILWIFRETLYELDGMTGWIWMIGLPAMLTIGAGGFMRRPLWELLVGASLSAAIWVLIFFISFFVTCRASRTASDDQTLRAGSTRASAATFEPGGSGQIRSTTRTSR